MAFQSSGQREESCGWITSRTFLFTLVLSYLRTDHNSFECYLPGHPIEDSRPDRVNVRSDGAYILTTKKKGDGKRIIWPRQKTVIDFEGFEF